LADEDDQEDVVPVGSALVAVVDRDEVEGGAMKVLVIEEGAVE